MGGSKPSSAKARAVRNALFALREETGLTQRAFADKYGFKSGTWARYETGERTPDAATLNEILDRLDVAPDRRSEILTAADGVDDPRWLAVTLPEQRAMLAAYLDFLASASHVTQVSPLIVPGFGQTGDYVRAIMDAANVPIEERNTRVAVRLGLRDVITRHHPATLLLLVGEAALHRTLGDREMLARQMRYLRELAEVPNVDLRVIPFDSPWAPDVEGAFDLIETTEDPVVHVENRRSGLFLHEEEDVALYRQAVDMVLRVAMSPAQSTGLIADVIKELETTT